MAEFAMATVQRIVMEMYEEWLENFSFELFETMRNDWI
jgi:hypothetical protein